MITAIKLYALASLLFTAAYAAWGYRHNKRREAAKREYRWWASQVVEHDLSELPPIIRTWQ